MNGCLTHTTQISSKYVKNLHVRPETIKIPDENMRKSLLALMLTIILCMWPKSTSNKSKRNKSDYVKLKAFCKIKEMTLKMKRQSVEQERKPTALNPCSFLLWRLLWQQSHPPPPPHTPPQVNSLARKFSTARLLSLCIPVIISQCFTLVTEWKPNCLKENSKSPGCYGRKM